MSQLPFYQSHGTPLLGQGGHTYCNSSQGNNQGFSGVASAIGGAFAARAEANQNWNNAKDYALRTNNDMALPNGTHYKNGLKVIVTDSTIRYENSETRMHTGIVKETGQPYTYSGL